MKKELFYVLVSILFFSCQDKGLDRVVADNNLYATVESVDATRTSMDQNNNVLWMEGDQLVAFMGTTLGARYEIKEEYVGMNTGAFRKVEEPGGGDDLESGQELDHNVVYYPYSSGVWCMKNDGNVPVNSYRLNVVLPQIQHYAKNSFANGAFPMAAVSSDNELVFRNVCGGLKLQITGGFKIKSIKLEGLGEELISGECNVVVYADGSAPTAVMDSENAAASITLDCGDGVQLDLDSPTAFILSVPPVEFKSGMQITITDTDGESMVLTNPSANTIKRSTLLTFSVTIEDASQGEGGDTDLSRYSDLSAAGTANCYLVKAAGDYKFQAVKGNSPTAIGGDIDEVEVLWESFGTNEIPQEGAIIASADYLDGYVVFSTPETFRNGNAVVAAKDTDGKILWSWHIWCSEEGWSDQVYPNGAGTMMDRNLGAISAVPGNVGALGLFYQWGRKDPFLGSSSITEKTLAASTGNWEAASGKKGVDYAVENPMVFITGSQDWCSSQTAELRWMDSQKTAYDPCPAGYRVPKGGTDGFWAVAKVESTYDSTNKGRNCKLSGDVYAWYPAAGNRNSGGTLASVGSNGYYWSATPMPNSITNSYNLLFSSGGFLGSMTTLRGNGIPVRCIKEQVL